jgi:hypothetical protein
MTSWADDIRQYIAGKPLIIVPWIPPNFSIAVRSPSVLHHSGCDGCSELSTRSSGYHQPKLLSLCSRLPSNHASSYQKPDRRLYHTRQDYPQYYIGNQQHLQTDISALDIGRLATTLASAADANGHKSETQSRLPRPY